MIWVFPHFSPIRWHFRSFHASLNCVNLNKYSRDSQSHHNNHWNFGWENPQKELWSNNTHQGWFPSIGRGPFLWCLCWFLYFPYRTSLDRGNTGHSWQVASQAGNGDSLASGMQNFPEQRPERLERVYLWYTLVRKVLYPGTSSLYFPRARGPVNCGQCTEGTALGVKQDLRGKSQSHFLLGKTQSGSKKAGETVESVSWDLVQAFLALGQRLAVLQKWFLYLMEVKCQSTVFPRHSW